MIFAGPTEEQLLKFMVRNEIDCSAIYCPYIPLDYSVEPLPEPVAGPISITLPPVMSGETITITNNSQATITVYGSGGSGGSQPHFRPLVVDDLYDPTSLVEDFVSCWPADSTSRGSKVTELPKGEPWPDTKFLSKRFLLTHCLKMTNEEILEHDRMMAQEHAYHNYNRAMAIVKPNG